MPDSTPPPMYTQLPLFGKPRQKCCTKCGNEYPETEEFWYKAGGKRNRYFRQPCKSCCNQQSREYQQEHIDQIREKKREWSRANPGRITEQVRRWKERNPERYRESYRKWEERNREKVRERFRLRRMSDPEKAHERDRRYREKSKYIISAIARRWRHNNAEKIRIKTNRRRAWKAAAEGSHTPEEIQALYEHQQGKCFHCGADISTGFHRDHWTPLKHGGSDYIDNIRLLCPPCNLSKGAKLPHEWDSRYSSDA